MAISRCCQTFPSRSAAKRRLICFPPAGGDALLFRDWQHSLDQEIEVVGIRLPGRGSRFAEAPYQDWETLLINLENEFRNLMDLPYVLFGHSFGGILAFELTRRIQKNNESSLLPQQVIISALESPKNNSKTLKVFKGLNDRDLMAELKNLGGIPAEVFAHQELMEFMLPVLRADLALLESYKFKVSAPLLCRIKVMAGEQDPLVSQDELISWQQQTRQKLQISMFSGGHFYFQEYAEDFFCELKNALAGCW